MEITGNTVLITGGSEGIGLALAKRLAPENTVIVCGRSSEKLTRARAEVPGLLTEVCDITLAAERHAMVARIMASFPSLNVLFNNAGAKHRTPLCSDAQQVLAEAMAQDMALNFTAAASLTLELLPQLRAQPTAAVVKMTTGLVHLPKAEQAFYCAAKAALRSFSQSLSWACKSSSVTIHEVQLTLVATNFHQGVVPKNIAAITADDAARITLAGLGKGKREIAVGKAALAPWLALLAPTRGMAIVNRTGA
jgi:uncharacterized oxidoreductase